MKAKLLKSLRIGGQSVKPGTDDAPVIADLDDAEFERLAKMNAVAEASQKDMKLCGLILEDTSAADKAAADKAAADKAAADNAAADKAAGKKTAPSASDL